MKKFIVRLLKAAAVVVCVPLIGTMFVKPDRGLQRDGGPQEKYDTGVIDSRFRVRVDEEIGSFYYEPEAFVELLTYRVVPENIKFSASQDYVATTGAAHDPEQEYLKALSIVCRSNIVSAWEAQGCPEVFRYGSMGLGTACFYEIPADDTKSAEIRRAAKAARGAVVTDEDGTAAVPFFTSAPSDLLVSQAGGGEGVSVNFSYEMARQGMDFYEILKYFLGDIKVNIYGE